MLANDPLDIQIKEIVSRYQKSSGKEEAEILFDDIIGHVEPVLNGVVTRYRIVGSEAEDLYQTIVLGLFVALPKYQPRNTASFFSYAEHIARAKVGELYKREKRRQDCLRKNGQRFVSLGREHWDAVCCNDSPLLNAIIKEETERQARKRSMRRTHAQVVGSKAWENCEYRDRQAFLNEYYEKGAVEHQPPDEFSKPIRSDQGIVYPSVYAASRQLKRAKKQFLLSIRCGYRCAGSRWQWA